MTRQEEVYAIAAVLAQTTEETRNQTLWQFCEAACAEVTAWLRKGVTPEACRSSFLNAAAMLAAGYFLAARKAGGVRSFQVGDVTVTECTEPSLTADLRTQARLLMRPFSTGRFYFTGVRG